MLITEDKELNEVFDKILKILRPQCVETLIGHLQSIHRQVEDLRTSRDNWRKKYEELKSSVGRITNND